MKAIEANFDGLVGPTHNYAGLSLGNLASTQSRLAVSNPKAAAKQGLAKMKALADRGLVQGVLPPQERPDLHTLRRLGFSGTDERVMAQAVRIAPALYRACCSASSMWSANAATVSPGADTEDGRVHMTPANLTATFHRAIEPATTGRLLEAIFPDRRYFGHHPPLPGAVHFGDEGAANHSRFCREYGEPGIELFVYGRLAFESGQPAPARYPARQTREACEAIARLHGLDPDRVIFAQQNPEVIDQGVFHNDVIAVGNRTTLFCHAQAYLDQAALKQRLLEGFGGDFHIIEVASSQLSVADAVASYLFNSQLLSLPDGRGLLVVPEECRQHPVVWPYLQELANAGQGIDALEVFDLRQSMRNGGGPACLRLRVVLTEMELAAVNDAVLMTDALYSRLNTWIDDHYRDRLSEADLADPRLLEESRRALDELTQILEIGSVYPFQREAG